MGVSVFNVTSGGIEWEGVLLEDGVIKLRGNATGLALDADGDTYLSAVADDIIDIFVGGSRDFRFTSNVFEVLTDSSIVGSSAAGNHYPKFIPAAAQQDISGPGTIDLGNYFTAMTTTGADSYTLADGDVIGKVKKITMIVDGGNGTLTPTSLSGGTNITFADVGDTAELIWDGSNWVAIALYNITDGATAPVLA